MKIMKETKLSDIECESTPEYEAFVEKFKPKLTTDDCYTPPEVYDAVKNWACKRFNIDPQKIVRPFYPEGDYESFDYSDGAVVLDNPPFSILLQIVKHYTARRIPFFLFAPSLMCFGTVKNAPGVSLIIVDAQIKYANGAKVPPSFVTNLNGDIVAETAPELDALLDEVQRQLRAERVKSLPKYAYDDHVLTAAMLKKYARAGVEFKVRRSECVCISKLDAQRDAKKTIFGSGLLLSEKAAEIVWKLSDRERALIAELG